MFNSTVIGRLYNGTTHEWVANKGKDNEAERTLFRGRLNYRDNENGNYHWIDAVCFKDFGETGGLVAWLDDHYSAENSECGDNGGEAIVLVGYVRPVTKKKTIEIKGKKGGKTVTKEIPNVPYETFEFVITSATFPPTSQGTKSKNEDVDAGDDFDFDEDIEVADSDDDAEDTEVEEKPKKSAEKSATKKAPNKDKKSSKKEPTPSDDDDFFDE